MATGEESDVQQQIQNQPQLSLSHKAGERVPSPMEMASPDPFDDLLSGWDDELLREGGPMSLVYLDDACAESSASHAASSGSKPCQQLCAPPREQASRSASRRGNSTKRRTGGSRIPPKVEIHHLRQEVPRLEEKLRELIERWKRMTVSVEQRIAQPRALPTASSNVQQWKDITLRQREQLSESEGERERLRTELQIQKKLSRAIQKLLSARTVSAVVDPRHVMPDYSCDLEKVVATANAMSSDVRKVHEVITSQRKGCSAFQGWAVQQESENGVFAEFMQSYEVPFRKAHVCRTLHSFLCKARKHSSPEFSGEVNDLRVQQFVIGLSEPKSISFVRIKEALNCIHTEAFSVYVISRVIDRKLSAPVSVAKLVERRWIIVSDGNRDTDGDDSTECSTTTIQSYYTMHQEKGDDNNEADALWNRFAIEHALIPRLDRGFAKDDRELETALVMQAKREQTEDLRTQSSHEHVDASTTD